MSHALLSPSGAHRWMVCPGSVQLESLVSVSPSSVYAAEGTFCHEIAARVIRDSLESESLKSASAFVGEAGMIDGFRVVLDEELAHAVDEYVGHVSRYIELGYRVMVEQEVPLSDLTGEPDAVGTVDFLAVEPGGSEVVVVDLKMGAGERVVAHRNPQLMMYACGAVKMLGVEPVSVKLEIVQPRAGGISSVSVSMRELRLFESTVSEAASRVVDAMFGDPAAFLRPDASACRWCRAKPYCPALSAFVKESVNMSPESLTRPEALAEAYRRVALVKQWANAVESATRAALLSGAELPGLRLEDGRAGDRAWSDAAAVSDRLRAAGLDPTEFSAVLSPAQMEKKLRRQPDVWQSLSDLIVRGEASKKVVVDPIE